MNEPWRKICEGCRHLNSQEPNQHCYMFRDAPGSVCAQNTQVMSKAKQDGTALTLEQVKRLDLSKV